MERNKQHSSVTTQELLTIKPKNGTNRVKFVSDIFGFKLDEHLIDLDEPLKEANSRVSVIGDTIVLDFELARYKKGEFAVLWQVFFFKDAAIMREESVYELNQLLGLMRSDDKMRIKIHGHTNGNSKGKVLHLDLDDKEFFSLNGSHNEDIASAKKLSEYRAYTIQHWLMDQGIPEERMEILGWGGKKMLHDKHDDKAHQNVRVEIEVLETS
jgi:outer membrane protein OmpA-like peptidoglycan-associated protein